MPRLNGTNVTSDYAVEHRQSQSLRAYTINGRQYPRVKHANDAVCDCLAAFNEYHHVGCDAELCPVCSHPVVDCDCLNGG